MILIYQKNIEFNYNINIFILEVIVSLSQGMQVVIADEEEQLNFEMLGETIKKHKINMLQVTPSRLQIMLENKYFVQCVDCIRILMVGGETLSSSLLLYIEKLRWK